MNFTCVFWNSFSIKTLMLFINIYMFQKGWYIVLVCHLASMLIKNTPINIVVKLILFWTIKCIYLAYKCHQTTYINLYINIYMIDNSCFDFECLEQYSYDCICLTIDVCIVWLIKYSCFVSKRFSKSVYCNIVHILIIIIIIVYIKY